MPPGSWWLFAAPPAQTVRPVYDTPPVIRKRRRRWFLSVHAAPPLL
jgi:hypothetical protein